MRAQESLSAAETQLQKFTAKVAEVSWGLLTTVPPLVASQPSRVSRRYHQTENWDNSHGSGQGLTYFRPVLFSSYEGRVAQKGWVTNRAMGCPIDITGLISREIGKTDVVTFSKPSKRHDRHREDKYRDFGVLGEEQHKMHGVQTALSDWIYWLGEERRGRGERRERGRRKREGSLKRCLFLGSRTDSSELTS